MKADASKKRQAETLKKVFSERILAAREQTDWSQGDLARKVGIHQTSLGGFEKGKSLPALGTAKALADALECPLDYLVGLTDWVEDEEETEPEKIPFKVAVQPPKKPVEHPFSVQFKSLSIHDQLILASLLERMSR